MHWDPGPYWDWEHYMSLLRAPIGGKDRIADRRAGWRGKGTYVVRPGFADNPQPLTGCVEAGVSCATQGTNFVYLRTAPSMSAPLVPDAGLRPDGSPSTTDVSDIGPRLTAGAKVWLAAHRGAWMKTWYLGAEAWFLSPRSNPVVVKSHGSTIQPKRGLDAVDVYGRAYPEEAAYPTEIPYQTVTPLGYLVGSGQRYVVADRSVPTDYYYAKTFDDSLPGDHTVVRGDDRYYRIWFGHRLGYVRAADVRLR